MGPGYRLGDRKLLIDEAEAGIVRSIFRRYVELRSVGKLVDELALQDVRTKVRQYSNGRTVGGVHFGRGTLSQLLKNPVFSGQVRHRGQLHPGEHDAILSVDQWNEVQRIIATNCHERKLGKRARYPSLLTGMITDPDERSMTPVFSSRASRQHRYYVTRLRPGEGAVQPWRVAAGEIDRAVITAICKWLRSHKRELNGDQLLSDRELADELPSLSIPEQRKLLGEIGVKVQLTEAEICLSFGADEQSLISLPSRMVHRGTELKLVLDDGANHQRDPDPVLLKLVALAMSGRKALFSSKVDPLTSHYSKRHFWQLLRISFLAPDIVAAIIEGRQPPSLTGRRLLRVTELPLDWPGQRRMLGFN